MLAAVLLSFNAAAAHEWTPTYPVFEPAFIKDVGVTTMTLFNKRADARFFQISVFDEDWNPILFATTNHIINVEYLKKKTIQIYVRKEDWDNVEYICTTSRLVENETGSSGVNSRICSRVL